MKLKAIKEVFVLLPVIFICGCASRVASATSAQTARKAPNLVYVGGEINKPGLYPWTNGMTAADLVHQAGGFTIFANSWLVIRRRGCPEEWCLLKPDIEVTNGIGTDWIVPDISLKPGDRVYNPHVYF